MKNQKDINITFLLMFLIFFPAFVAFIVYKAIMVAESIKVILFLATFMTIYVLEIRTLKECGY